MSPFDPANPNAAPPPRFQQPPPPPPPGNVVTQGMTAGTKVFVGCLTFLALGLVLVVGCSALVVSGEDDRDTAAIIRR